MSKFSEEAAKVVARYEAIDAKIDASTRRVVTIDRSALQSMTVAELHAFLSSAAELTVELIGAMVDAWRLLEAKGEDLSRYRKGLLRWVCQIVQGALVPEAIVTFHNTSAMRLVSMLPPVAQTRLSADPRVTVVEKSPTGYTTRMLDVRDLVPAQLKQVFGDREVRTEGQQIAYLSATAPPWHPHQPVKLGSIKVDRSGLGTFQLGKAMAPLADVVEALRKAGVTIA